MSELTSNRRRGRPHKVTSQQMAPSVDEHPLMSSEPTEAELEGVDAATLEGLDLHAGQAAESDSTDAVSLYLREISRTALLTHEQETHLAIRNNQGRSARLAATRAGQSTAGGNRPASRWRR